jgi:hypothetical protein
MTGRSILLRTCLANAGLLSAGLCAAAPPATAGATSEAKISISVSVARRMGLHAFEPRNGEDARLRSLCVWSSLPSHAYTLKLEETAHDARQGAGQDAAGVIGLKQALLLPGVDVQATARPSAGDCERAADEERLLVAPIGSAGSVLVILAPE